jgi:hypothetical protein
MLGQMQKKKFQDNVSIGGKNLTRKIIPLWHVVLRKEREFEVVHEEEPEMRARSRCHTTS